MSDRALMVAVTHRTEDCEDTISIYPCSDEEQLERVFRLAIESVKKYCLDDDPDNKTLDGYSIQEGEDYFQIWLDCSIFSMFVEKMRLPYDTTEISFNQ